MRILAAGLAAMVVAVSLSGCLEPGDEYRDWGCPPTYYYEGVEATLIYSNQSYDDEKLYEFFQNESVIETLEKYIFANPNRFGPGYYRFYIKNVTDNSTATLAKGSIYGEDSPLTVTISYSSSNPYSFSAGDLDTLNRLANETFANDTISLKPILQIFDNVFSLEFGTPSEIHYDIKYSAVVC